MKERRKEKQQKKKNWATKGGFIAPIVVPATPNSELKNGLQETADKCSDGKIRFKIIERGGVTLKRMLQKSNPTSSGFCGKEDQIQFFLVVLSGDDLNSSSISLSLSEEGVIPKHVIKVLNFANKG